MPPEIGSRTGEFQNRKESPMRNRIARACSVLAAGIAVTSVIGFSAASMASASVAAKPNATPACGFFCFNLYSRVLGDGTIQNAYVPGDTGVGGRVGQKVNMKYASNSHPNEDLQVERISTVPPALTSDDL